jgi:hypothetical protein
MHNLLKLTLYCYPLFVVWDYLTPWGDHFGETIARFVMTAQSMGWVKL